MFRKTIIILTFTIITASIACTQKEVDPIQERIKTTLSELRGNAPETIIDLDKAAEVTLTPAFTLSDEHLEDSGLFFADINSVHFADETYYVVDAKQHTIFKFNQQFEHIGNIGQYGRGPVDFQQPGDIIKMHDRYIVADIGNMRMQILDTELDLLTVIPDIYFMTFYPHVSANADFLAVLNYNPLSDYSLVFYSHADYSTVINKLMPRILDPGEIPMSLNLIQFSINRLGTIVAAYKELPHIFVYDTDFELADFITLNGLSAIDDNGDYILNSENVQDARFTLNRVSSLLMDEKNNVFFISRAENIIYYLKNDSGRYNASIKLRLEELSQNPLMLAFLAGDYLAIVDKKYANRIHFYDLYQP